MGLDGAGATRQDPGTCASGEPDDVDEEVQLILGDPFGDALIVEVVEGHRFAHRPIDTLLDGISNASERVGSDLEALRVVGLEDRGEEQADRMISKVRGKIAQSSNLLARPGAYPNRCGAGIPAFVHGKGADQRYGKSQYDSGEG